MVAPRCSCQAGTTTGSYKVSGYSYPGRAGQRRTKGGQEAESGSQEDVAASNERAVGSPLLSRPEVVSKVWEYMKAKSLQNTREIMADKGLRSCSPARAR
jgi:hypothetical protein